MRNSKFKYQSYDYSKIGIPKIKVHYRHFVGDFGWHMVSKMGYCKEEFVDKIVGILRDCAIKECPQIEYNPNYEFEWEIITPEKTYKSNEASSKEE